MNTIFPNATNITSDFISTHLLVVDKKGELQFTKKITSDFKWINYVIKFFRYVFNPSSRQDHVNSVLISKIDAYKPQSLEEAIQTLNICNLFYKSNFQTCLNVFDSHPSDQLLKWFSPFFTFDGKSDEMTTEIVTQKYEKYIEYSARFNASGDINIIDVYYKKVSIPLLDSFKALVVSSTNPVNDRWTNSNVDKEKVFELVAWLKQHLYTTYPKLYEKGIHGVLHNRIMLSY